jgi:SAM-dependent methyltransferase
MKNLSEKRHWDSQYVVAKQDNPAVAPLSLKKKALQYLKQRLSPRTLKAMSSYAEYQLWSVLLPHHLPSLLGKPMLEVGSALGDNLLKFHERTGCIPYGVEYSDTGVEVNRAKFAAHNLDPENVIHSDFFLESFQKPNRNRFDLVYSGGFIEHFDDAKAVVAKHIDLTALGGHVLISIPNLRGANYLLSLLFAPWLLPIHNLKIMPLREFRQLFQDERIEPLVCQHFGTFSFNIFQDDDETRNRVWRQKALAVCQYAQPLLNLTFRRLLGDRGVENGWTSPYLVFIGRKVKS